MLSLSVLLLQSCGGGYSFTGGSVGDAKTISVDYFLNKAPLVNPNLSQSLTEEVKTTFIQQTPLELVTRSADLIVEGSIIGYEVRPMSAQGNETTSQSRFTITIKVKFTNNLEPEKSYEQTMSRFRDFSSDNLFSDVENQLVEEINQELAEDIMNRAIANW
jgi:hypothetical protein